MNDLNLARYALAGSGIQTASLAFGGLAPAPPLTANTESWNGTNWTQADEMNTARQSYAGSGTQTAALAAGGFTTVALSNTEEYNDPYYDNLTITTT